MTDQPTRPSKTEPFQIPNVPVTPLYDVHVGSGARMVEFGGWMMPLQYTGIIDEHRAVRTAAGLFDVSHMGEVELRGPGALAAVQKLSTNDASKLAVGAAMYTLACNERGGIVDDWIVYRLAENVYRIVTNAANHAKDFAWSQAQVGGTCELVDLSEATALLAMQGPKAVAILRGLWRGPELAAVKGFSVVNGEVASIPVIAARTGYTGEDGFELFCDAAQAPALWKALMAAGSPSGLQACGLGCRDTLRLEARLSLYGNELDDSTTPLEAGLARWVSFDKGDFIGRAALVKQKDEGVGRTLVGLRMTGRGIGRHGYSIHAAPGTSGTPSADGTAGGRTDAAGVSQAEGSSSNGPVAVGDCGTKLGEVTSGAPSPSLGYPIALGYVPPAYSAAGTKLVVDCRGKGTTAEVVSGPFYRRPR